MSAPKESDSAFEGHEYILGTPVKWSWLEQKLCASLRTNARFGDHRNAKQIGIGKGFLSVVGRVYPEWTPRDDRLPRSVAIKIATHKTFCRVMEESKEDERTKEFMEATKMDEAMDGVGDFLENVIRDVHNNEVEMYTLIEKNNLALKVPKTFVLQKFDDECPDGVIVMEDMGEDSITASSYDIVTVDQVYQVIDQLVELHRFSYESSEWMSVLSDTDIGTMMERQSNRWTMMEAMLRSLQCDDETLAPLIDRVVQDIKSLGDWTTPRKVPEMFGIPRVIAHGDLWIANMMWRVDGGKKTLAGVLDWQIAHPGSAAEDIARFVTCALTAKDRREHWKDILKYYYEKLREKMKKEPSFSYEQLEQSFVVASPYALLMITGAMGPMAAKEIEKLYPDGKEELMAILREKARGVVEDILYFQSLNHRSDH